jgi:hypothetical protein
MHGRHTTMPNQYQQAELGKLSSFLKKHSKKPPFHPIRCGRRYKFYTKIRPLYFNVLQVSTFRG